MIRLILILLILNCGNLFGQWPSLNLYSVAGQAQIRNNITYAVNRGCDSLGKVFDAKLKLLEAAFDKKLKDSMATVLPIDEKTIVSINGKATAIAGAADLKPVYDSIGKVDARLTSTTKVLTDNILILGGRTTTLENKVSSLEAWKGTVDSQLTTINAAVALLKTQVATIPKGVELTY